MPCAEGYSTLHKEFTHVKQQWREEREARMELEASRNSSEQGDVLVALGSDICSRYRLRSVAHAESAVADINRDRELWEREREKLVSARDDAQKMLKAAESQIVQMEVAS